MPDTLAKLESDGSKLLEEFLLWGDLRPGSITAVIRRRGKPTCHRAKPDDPGYDPQLRLTRRVAGKPIAETFPNPIALRKAQHEVAEFHHSAKTIEHSNLCLAKLYELIKSGTRQDAPGAIQIQRHYESSSGGIRTRVNAAVRIPGDDRETGSPFANAFKVQVGSDTGWVESNGSLGVTGNIRAGTRLPL